MPVNETSNTLKTAKHKTKNKKPINEKEIKTVSQCTENKASEIAGSSSTVNQKITSVGWFTSEIQSMMYGFGDCKNPLLESAQLIEEIVHQQINSLLIQSAEVANIRNARFIGLEDIVFLMRKDKVKLSRLVHYLAVKDAKNAITKTIFTEDDEITESGNTGTVETKVQSRLKRAKLCQDFINSISLTGGMLPKCGDDIVDDVKIEREIRAFNQTNFMDQNQYIEYCEARRSSFARKYRSTKFRDWLLKDNLTDIKPNAIALEIFNYLAFETVAQIVDLSLLVKQDSQGHPGDPFSRLMLPVVYNPDYPNIQIAQVSRPDSPSLSSMSPPSSPSSQDKPSQHSSVSNSIPNKPKPKKRQKCESKTTWDLSCSRCIQPSDIREAIRRYWRPTGPMMLFSKLHHSHLGTRLLFC